MVCNQTSTMCQWHLSKVGNQNKLNHSMWRISPGMETWNQVEGADFPTFIQEDTGRGGKFAPFLHRSLFHLLRQHLKSKQHSSFHWRVSTSLPSTRIFLSHTCALTSGSMTKEHRKGWGVVMVITELRFAFFRGWKPPSLLRSPAEACLDSDTGQGCKGVWCIW